MWSVSLTEWSGLTGENEFKGDEKGKKAVTNLVYMEWCNMSVKDPFSDENVC